MQKFVNYLYLLRIHKPIGILLLLWPTLWALWIASHGKPSSTLVFIFVLGVIVMRSLGCLINDIVDRNIDKHVERTRNRPITSGAVSLLEAIIISIVLSVLALYLVSFLTINCFYLAIIGLLITFIYPFCKRFFSAPQLILGIAFAWGIPMVYMEIIHKINVTCCLLMSLTYIWTVCYDTQYAMVDKKDDQIIGIFSTAILFGYADRYWIAAMQGIIQLNWLLLANYLHLNYLFYLFFSIGLGIFIYQQFLIKEREPKACFKAFLSNHWYGLSIWLGLFFSFSI